MSDSQNEVRFALPEVTQGSRKLKGHQKLAIPAWATKNKNGEKQKLSFIEISKSR